MQFIENYTKLKLDIFCKFYQFEKFKLIDSGLKIILTKYYTGKEKIRKTGNSVLNFTT